MEAPKPVWREPAETPRRTPLHPPFVGRSREISQLHEFHGQRKHVLILGPVGVGKSALVLHLRAQLRLLVSLKSEHLGEICDNLEPELHLVSAGTKLLKRKQRLRQALGETGRTVVFDGAGWTTPKLSSFLETVAERVPVWICARSDHPWDIGRIWPFLVRFARVELHPFHPAETRALIQASVLAGIIPAEVRNIAEWLHRRSAGSPLVLRELFDELATGKYDLANPYALRRLDLDRRIHEIFPSSNPIADGPKGKAL